MSEPTTPESKDIDPSKFEGPEYREEKRKRDPFLRFLREEAGLSEEEINKQRIHYRSVAEVEEEAGKLVVKKEKRFSNYHDYLTFRSQLTPEDKEKFDQVKGPGLYANNLWDRFKKGEDLYDLKEKMEKPLYSAISGELPDEYAEAVKNGEIPEREPIDPAKFEGPEYEEEKKKRDPILRFLRDKAGLSDKEIAKQKIEYESVSGIKEKKGKKVVASRAKFSNHHDYLQFRSQLTPEEIEEFDAVESTHVSALNKFWNRFEEKGDLAAFKDEFFSEISSARHSESPDGYAEAVKNGEIPEITAKKPRQKGEGFLTRAEKFLEKSTIGKKLLGQEVEAGAKAGRIEKTALIASKTGDIVSSVFGVRILARLPDRTLKRIYSKREITRIKGTLKEEVNLKRQLEGVTSPERREEIESRLRELGYSETETKSDRVNRRMAEIEKRLSESKYLSEEKRAKLREKLDAIRTNWAENEGVVETDMESEVDSVLNQFVGDRMKKSDVLKESFDAVASYSGAFAIRAVGRGGFGIYDRYSKVKDGKKEGEKVQFLKEVICGGAVETAQEMFGQGKLKEVKGFKKTLGVVGAWGKAAIPAAIALMGYSEVAEKGGHAFTKALERAGERAGEISEAWGNVSNPGEAVHALISTLNLQESAHRLSLGLIGKEDVAAGAAGAPEVVQSTAGETPTGGVPDATTVGIHGVGGGIHGGGGIVEPDLQTTVETSGGVRDLGLESAVPDAITSRVHDIGSIVEPGSQSTIETSGGIHDLGTESAGSGHDHVTEVGKTGDAATAEADKAAAAAAATAEAAKAPVAMSIELGQEGGPQYVEQAFYRVAIDNMELHDKITNVEGARILNVGANLRELSEGHGVSGISPEEFGKYVDIEGDKITITDYKGFQTNIMGKLVEHSQQIITEENVGDSGAVAYLDDIKDDTWMEMLKPKGIGAEGLQFDHEMIGKAEGQVFQDTLGHSGIGKLATDIQLDSESNGGFDLFDQHVVVDHGRVLAIGDVKLDQPIILGTKQAGDQLLVEVVRGMKIEIPQGGGTRPMNVDIEPRIISEAAHLETISKEGAKALDDLEEDITKLIHADGHGQRTLGLTLEQIRSQEGKDLLEEALKADGGRVGRADNIQREVMRILNNSDAVNHKQTLARFLMHHTDDEAVKSAVTGFNPDAVDANTVPPVDETVKDGANSGTIDQTPPTGEGAGQTITPEVKSFTTPEGNKIEFQYGANGEVLSISISGKIPSSESLLSPVYGSEVSYRGGNLTEAFKEVENSAQMVKEYNYALHSLETTGQGNTPEAEYLRKSIQEIITSSEKKYGNIFRDVSTVPPDEQPVSHDVGGTIRETPAGPGELGQATPQEVNLALENLAGGIQGIDKLSLVDINKLEDIATLDKLKDGAEEVLRQLPGMIEHPPQGMDAESLKALARGYQEVLKTIDARIDAVDVMGQSGSFTHDVGSVGGTGAEMIHDASGEHLGTYETPDGLRVDFQYNPNGEISGINFKGFMRGEVQSLNPDFEQNIQQAIQSGKLKPSEYAVAADKIRTDGRTVDLYRKVIDSMEKGGKGSTPEAEALREHIERIIESAEKRYGDVFKG